MKRMTTSALLLLQLIRLMVVVEICNIMMRVDAALSIHPAVPDALIRLIEEHVFVQYTQTMPLKVAVPICDSSFGPHCHHLDHRLSYETAEEESTDLTELQRQTKEMSWMNSVDESRASYVHRFPLMPPGDSTSIDTRPRASCAVSSLENPMMLDGFRNTFVTQASDVHHGFQLHSEYRPYEPIDAFLGSGLDDIFTKEELAASLYKASEVINIEENTLNEIWSTINDDRVDDRSCVNKTKEGTCSNRRIVGVHAATLDWRPVSYMLEFESCTHCMFNNVVPLLYKGNLPSVLQTRWEGLWKTTKLQTRMLSHFTTPSLDGVEYKELSPIFIDLQLYSQKLTPSERSLLLLNEKSSSNQHHMKHPYAATNEYIPSFHTYAILHSNHGCLEFFSPTVMSSMWVTLLPPQHSVESLMAINGIRITASLKGHLQWVIAIPYETLHYLLPKHEEKETILFDAIKLAKFTPFVRIDMLKFEYTFSSESSDKMSSLQGNLLAVGGAVLNIAKSVHSYQPNFSIESDTPTVVNGDVLSTGVVDSQFMWSQQADEFPSTNTEIEMQETGVCVNSKRQETAQQHSHSTTRTLSHADLSTKSVASFTGVILRSHDDEEHIALKMPDSNQSLPYIRRSAFGSFDASILHSVVLPNRGIESIQGRESEGINTVDAVDMRPSMKRVGVYLQELPIEAPVVSIGYLNAEMMGLSKKSTVGTIAPFIDLYEPKAKQMRLLRAAEHSSDISKALRLVDNLFVKSNHLGLHSDEIEIVRFTENGKTHIIYKARLSPTKILKFHEKMETAEFDNDTLYNQIRSLARHATKKVAAAKEAAELEATAHNGGVNGRELNHEEVNNSEDNDENLQPLIE